MHVGLHTPAGRQRSLSPLPPKLLRGPCIKAVLVWEALPPSELLCCISSPLTRWKKLCLLSWLNRGQIRFPVFGIWFCSRMQFVRSGLGKERCRLIKLNRTPPRRTHISGPSDWEASIGFKNVYFIFAVYQTPLKTFDRFVLQIDNSSL